jgi:two-component system, response regulator PdtaR
MDGAGTCMQAKNPVGEVGPDIPLQNAVILIVEDEVLIRMGIAEHLRQEGFQVLEAANADEARLVLKANPQIEAVFSDCNMPSPRDGLQLALWIGIHLPSLPVVLTSGVNTSAEKQAIKATANVEAFLLKPYEYDELVRLLVRCIARRKQGSGS